MPKVRKLIALTPVSAWYLCQSLPRIAIDSHDRLVHSSVHKMLVLEIVCTKEAQSLS